MKEKLAVNKKRLSCHRIIKALIKGIFWGWSLSFCLSLFYWQVGGFETANNRLINMIQAEQYIEQTYSDTKIFAFVESMSVLIAHTVKGIAHSSAINTAGHQLQGAIGGKENSYLAPAAHKVDQLWLYIKKGIIKTIIIVKNNSLMVLGKLLLFVLSLPLLGLSWLFGIVDGFALREVRTAELGRESSFIFHRFLGFVPGILWLLITIYLVVPLWINPVVFFMGVSLMTLLLASRMVSKFKKYV